jgi:tetratricopeptide (TPR) repeat protein
LAGLYYFKCDRYKKLKLYNKSIENSLYFVDELKKDPEGEYFEQSWPLYYMGLDFYYYKDYSKALELALAAYKHNNKNNPNTSWFVKGCSDLIAMSYLKNGKFDSAKNWLDTTLHYANLHNDTAWIGIATGNLGSIYYLQQQYSKAIPYYEKAILYCKKYYLWDNVAPFCTNLADCYMQTGNDEAVPALLKEADYANRNNNLPGPNNAASTFKIISVWYRSLGNAILALQYADSSNFYQKKLDDEYSIIAKMQAEANLAYRNKELENVILKQEEKKGKLIRYGLIGALFMVASISILLYKRQKLQHQLKKEKLEHEKLIAEEELHIAMVEIKDFTQNIREKNELIENFAEEINNLKLQNNTITDTQVSFIEDLKQSTILTDGDWARFKQIFEKVHPGFLTRLKTKYPDLTPAETRYLLFTKLGLLPKEMMSVLGVSAEAIRNVRFRIKKKLSPDDKKEIEDFLKEV